MSGRRIDGEEFEGFLEQLATEGDDTNLSSDIRDALDKIAERLSEGDPLNAVSMEMQKTRAALRDTIAVIVELREIIIDLEMDIARREDEIIQTAIAEGRLGSNADERKWNIRYMLSSDHKLDEMNRKLRKLKVQLDAEQHTVDTLLPNDERMLWRLMQTILHDRELETRKAEIALACLDTQNAETAEQEE